MTVRVEWVRYGRDAAAALRAAIAAAKGDEPLSPVTVVVPSNHVGVAARRWLASGSLGPACGRGVGLAAVTFVTPYRLAELLGAPVLAGAGRRPVSTPVIAAAVRAALAEDPGVFAPVSEHPATEAALVTAYRELRDLTPGALDALARTGRRAGDVVRLHHAARDALERAWYDEEDLMVAAAESLGAGAHPDLGTVVAYLPQRLSRHVSTMLAAVAKRAGGLMVLAGTTGDVNADAEIARSLAALTGAPPPTPSFDAVHVVDTERTRLVTTSDADDEVRAALRAVVDAVRSGTPLDRIALLYATPLPYGRLAHEQLSAAGIPANGAAVVPLAARMAGRALLQLLDLPAAGYRRQDVFAWLTTAPVQLGRTPAPVTAWERASRDAAVVAGRDDWDRRLAAHADKLEQRAADTESDPDAPPKRADALRARARRARQLREFVLDRIDDLERAAAAPRRWAEHSRWALDRLTAMIGPGDPGSAWPAPERRAAERIELALQRLGALDAVEGAVGLDVFTRTLALELEADLGRVGRFGTGVLVGSVGMGVGLDLDLVVVLGLAEGSFPASIHDDSLLPDHERAKTAGELPLSRERTERQHRELLASLAGADRHLLGIPRGDLRRSNELVPSRWVLAIASRLGGRRWWSEELLAADDVWLRHVPSFDAGLRALASPATEQEFRLHGLEAATLDPRADPVLARATEVVRERRSDRFTRFDGNLARLPIPSPVDGVMSPTRLERWAMCPFSYLLQDVLGVEPVENPEEQLRITPLDRGDLVHRILERFILGVLDRPVEEQPAPDEPWSTADRSRLLGITDDLCAEAEAAGLTGRPIFWRRDRAEIIGDLERFLDEDNARRREGKTRPVAAELAFGSAGAEVSTVALPLPDGRVLRFRGKADRVDLAEDGTIHIVDYKTGKPDDFRALCADDPDLRGRKLQLVVYGLAARRHRGDDGAPVKAEYWFVSRRGNFEPIGYEITPAVLERVGHTVATMVAGIESGAFPNHPTASSTSPFVECHACDPDALGVTELRTRWEHKRRDPALAPYADLAEPLTDATGGETAVGQAVAGDVVSVVDGARGG